MPSNVRIQLENWLSTIEVSGRVVDVGGLHLPVKGRTKTWDVEEYKILDFKNEYKGTKSDIVANINYHVAQSNYFDTAFCLEVMEYIFNPVNALWNIGGLLKKGGRLYISTHFIFPYHSGGEDCLRYTKDGIIRLLKESGFEIKNIIPRITCEPELLKQWMDKESKVTKYPNEIGHLVTASKV